MPYPIDPPVSPMLAKLERDLPQGPPGPRGQRWLYEPKWDGFRAIVFKDGERIHIGSRNSLPLERYFPELLPVFAAGLPSRCVVDGEIVIAAGGGLEFEMLQMRLHPAASRVKMLAAQIPSSFIAFDMLARASKDLREKPFASRRGELESATKSSDQLFLTPQTEDAEVAREWFETFEGAGLDGIVAKRSDLRYVPGERVMIKVKHERTADCIVIGYRTSKSGDGIGSLLLGMYDAEGTLHFVGHTSSFKAPERRLIFQELQPLVIESFEGEGRSPGEPSRWSRDKDLAWTSLEPKLVCEVAFDHMQGQYRFRHGTTFRRWRPDKQPEECTFDQITPPRPFSIEEIRKLA